MQDGLLEREGDAQRMPSSNGSAKEAQWKHSGPHWRAVLVQHVALASGMDAQRMSLSDGSTGEVQWKCKVPSLRSAAPRPVGATCSNEPRWSEKLACAKRVPACVGVWQACVSIGAAKDQAGRVVTVICRTIAWRYGV